MILRDRALSVAAIFLAAVLFLMTVIAIIALLVHVTPVATSLAMRSDIVRQALWLSLRTSVMSVCLIALCGTPLAAILARPFRGRSAVETLVMLPVVLPPVVGGFALLLAFGRAGLLGRELSLLGIHLPFTTAAVVIAQTFVAAPLYVAVARSAFSRVDPVLVEAAATLRASPTYTFLRVVLPPAVPALAAGLALAWARALGEFGATITFAGNLPGVTQTMPVAVYVAAQTDLESAIVVAVMLMILSYAALLVVRVFASSPSTLT